MNTQESLDDWAAKQAVENQKREAGSRLKPLPGQGGKKVCTRCRAEKPLAEFPRSKNASKSPSAKSKGRSSWCHDCILAQKRDYYRRNYPVIQARCMEWRRNNRERYSGYMRNRYRANPRVSKGQTLVRLYGITLEDFEAISRRQNDRCAICLEEAKLVVDHCHELGVVRGLLCSDCNLAIGQLKDNPVIALRASEYLCGEPVVVTLGIPQDRLAKNYETRMDKS